MEMYNNNLTQSGELLYNLVYDIIIVSCFRKGGRLMLKKIMKMRIQKRLTYSSLITIGISAIASLFAILVVIFMVWRYDYVLTYYAFPQGDIGHAMAA